MYQLMSHANGYEREAIQRSNEKTTGAYNIPGAVVFVLALLPLGTGCAEFEAVRALAAGADCLAASCARFEDGCAGFEAGTCLAAGCAEFEGGACLEVGCAEFEAGACLAASCAEFEAGCAGFEAGACLTTGCAGFEACFVCVSASFAATACVADFLAALAADTAKSKHRTTTTNSFILSMQVVYSLSLLLE